MAYFTRYELLSSLIFVTDRRTDGQTDRQTESDAYEPTVQFAQVGSKMAPSFILAMSSTKFVYQAQTNNFS